MQDIVVRSRVPACPAHPALPVAAASEQAGGSRHAATCPRSS